jgi:hypothetical protein
MTAEKHATPSFRGASAASEPGIQSDMQRASSPGFRARASSIPPAAIRPAERRDEYGQTRVAKVYARSDLAGGISHDMNKAEDGKVTIK